VKGRRGGGAEKFKTYQCKQVDSIANMLSHVLVKFQQRGKQSHTNSQREWEREQKIVAMCPRVVFDST